MNKSKKYISSKKEMNRRKIAFLSLEMSLFITICICFVDFIMLSPLVAVLIIIICFIALMLLFNMVSKLLNKQSNYRFYIFNDELKREFTDSSEKYLIVNIESMRIKRTSKGIIREIKFNMKNKKSIFINGIDEKNFEIFKNDLINKNKNIKIKLYKEPIDLDHPLFYPILGIIVGMISSVLFRLMLNVDKDIYTYIKNSISCFIILWGFFWIAKKPISRTYGKKIVYKDIIVGVLSILIGILFLFYLKY